MNLMHNAFFGEVLWRFRKRKRLSQQRLAGYIGVHRDSISSWERGEYFPETPTTLHELARVLMLDAEEKCLLFESLYGTVSILPFYNLPEHNPYFTGREQVLHQMHQQMTTGTSVTLSGAYAISGLGGIGKTQMALAYAYRFREHYRDIFWVQAETQETLVRSYLTFAEHLRLPEREQHEPRQVIEAIKRWLREHKSWLFILDNIEKLELLRELVPSLRQGTVLLTTRQAEVAPFAHSLALDVMTEEGGSRHPERFRGTRQAARQACASKSLLSEIAGDLGKNAGYITQIRQEAQPEKFAATILTGCWTTCLEILSTKERSRGDT
ncbi:MAG TPA: helix-turn-helix domain-containing protein [Ktedonobacteraceae bacterium]|nr:helix-turn-helix domain-containing protein [Ktedonobacteraceae bacterium]